jgi:hypothetical protein
MILLIRPAALTVLPSQIRIRILADIGYSDFSSTD